MHKYMSIIMQHAAQDPARAELKLQNYAKIYAES